MSKLEEYTEKAAASVAAAGAATTDRDRAFHQRAVTIWRKLIRGIGEAEERAAAAPAPKPTKSDTRASAPSKLR